jgi:hypothetical protein
LNVIKLRSFTTQGSTELSRSADGRRNAKLTEKYKQASGVVIFSDFDAVNSVPLGPLRPWLDNPFCEHEVTAAVWKMTYGKSAGDSKCPPSITKHF